MQRVVEAVGVRVDDPVAVDTQTNERELLAPGGVSENLDHDSRLAAPPCRDPRPM